MAWNMLGGGPLRLWLAVADVPAAVAALTSLGFSVLPENALWRETRLAGHGIELWLRAPDAQQPEGLSHVSVSVDRADQALAALRRLGARAGLESYSRDDQQLTFEVAGVAGLRFVVVGGNA